MNLFISTATDKLYLAIFDKELKKEIIHQGHNDHTVKLYEKLNELDFELRDIKKIFLITGPGSYTGLRVGVVFAKALAMANEIEIVPIGLIEAMQISEGNEKVCSDAKGKKYFFRENDQIKLAPLSELDGYLIDPVLDLKILLKDEIFLSKKGYNYKEVHIDYVKSAI